MLATVLAWFIHLLRLAFQSLFLDSRASMSLGLVGGWFSYWEESSEVEGACALSLGSVSSIEWRRNDLMRSLLFLEHHSAISIFLTIVWWVCLISFSMLRVQNLFLASPSMRR